MKAWKSLKMDIQTIITKYMLGISCVILYTEISPRLSIRSRWVSFAQMIKFTTRIIVLSQIQAYKPSQTHISMAI